MIALRADDEIDGRLAPRDLAAFGLGDAARDRDDRILAITRAGRLSDRGCGRDRK